MSDQSYEHRLAGKVIILNGAPRSGKSSIAAEIIKSAPGAWANIGVDSAHTTTPPALRPGIGLRPGGERPDLEDHLPALWAALYSEVADRSRSRLNTVVDASHHCSYGQDLSPWRTVVSRIGDLPVLIVGVRCPLEEILRRRALSSPDTTGHSYLTAEADGSVPEPIIRWQMEVHRPGVYDLEVDTGSASSAHCARRIIEHERSVGGRFPGHRGANHSPPGAAIERLRALLDH